MFLETWTIHTACCHDFFLHRYSCLFCSFESLTFFVKRQCVNSVPLIKATGARGGLFGAGGRFKGGTDPIMEKFNESMWFDKRMWAQDIRGSVAYAKAIGNVGIITDEEVQLLVKGLGDVHKEWEEGKFEIKPGDEGKFAGCVSFYFFD